MSTTVMVSNGVPFAPSFKVIILLPLISSESNTPVNPSLPVAYPFATVNSLSLESYNFIVPELNIESLVPSIFLASKVIVPDEFLSAVPEGLM